MWSQQLEFHFQSKLNTIYACNLCSFCHCVYQDSFVFFLFSFPAVFPSLFPLSFCPHLMLPSICVLVGVVSSLQRTDSPVYHQLINCLYITLVLTYFRCQIVLSNRWLSSSTQVWYLVLFELMWIIPCFLWHTFLLQACLCVYASGSTRNLNITPLLEGTKKE